MEYIFGVRENVGRDAMTNRKKKDQMNLEKRKKSNALMENMHTV